LCGFFSHALVILNLRTASRNGGSLSDCPSSSTPSAAFHQRSLHGDFRIAPSFTFLIRRQPLFLTATSGTTARRWVGWVRLLVCFLIFSLFFLLTSSFAAQSPRSPLLADGHGPPFPRGPTSPHYRPRQHMTTLTCPLVTSCAVSPCPSRLHAPRRLAPRGCAHRVASPLAAARTASPRPSRLRAPRRLAPRGCTHHVAVPASPCFLRRLTPSACTFSVFFFC
jgi:hypothetical protein